MGIIKKKILGKISKLVGNEWAFGKLGNAVCFMVARNLASMLRVKIFDACNYKHSCRATKSMASGTSALPPVSSWPSG